MSEEQQAPNTEEKALTIQDADKWVTVAYRGSVALIVILSGVYAFFPVDAVPDVLLVAGQIDDLIAVLSGASSIAAITVARPLVMRLMRNPVFRTGCLVAGGVIFFSLVIGAIILFYGLYSLYNQIF